MRAESYWLLEAVYIDGHTSFPGFFHLIVGIVPIFLVKDASFRLVYFNWSFFAGTAGLSIRYFMFPTVFIYISILQRHPRLVVLLFFIMFFEDAVDLFVDGFDAVLLDAEHTVRDARTVFVGEVKVAEGLRSGNELGSVGKVAGAEGRVVGEGNVDFG